MLCFDLIRIITVLQQAKGSDAAATMGTEAAVYAAEASDNNDLLERILPATVSDYIDLVKAHIDAGGCEFIWFDMGVNYIQLHVLILPNICRTKLLLCI